MTVALHHGDCRDVLKRLPAESVQCVVTSPPYLGLRSYLPDGHPDKAREIGLEPSPAEFVAAMVEVFREIRRVLRKDGTAWLNLGSSYASRDIRPNLSRQPRHAPACGTAYTAPSGCLDLGSACRDPDGEPQGDFPSRHGRTAGIARLLGEADERPCTTAHDTGRLGCAVASPDASHRAVLASNNPSSPANARDAAGRADEVSASRPELPTASPSSLGSAHTSACTSDTVSSAAPSARRMSGKESSSAACGDPKCDGSCGVCWAYLAIPLLKFKQKDLMEIPTLVALALQADGWYIRSEILWAKMAPMPESVRDRPTCAHEKVWLLTKSARYFYDAEAVREPFADERMGNPGQYQRTSSKSKGANNDRQDGGFLNNGSGWDRGAELGGRNLRNVWSLPPEPSSLAHFAMMPTRLAETCIKAGSSEKGQCPHCGSPWVRVVNRTLTTPGTTGGATPYDGHRPDGMKLRAGGFGGGSSETTGWSPSCSCPPHEPVPQTVLDCFAGAGTTLLVADRLQRHAVGIELNPDNCRLIRERLAGDAPLFSEVA